MKDEINGEIEGDMEVWKEGKYRVSKKLYSWIPGICI